MICGPIHLERILQVVRGYSGQIQSCVDISAKTHPDLYGRVAIAWTVEGGVVHDPEIVDSTVRDPELEQCMVRAVGRMHFPGTVNATVTSVPWSVQAGH